MIKSVVTATMENGDEWEAIRRSHDGLSDVIHNIWKDDVAGSFCVEETKA